MRRLCFIVLFAGLLVAAQSPYAAETGKTPAAKSSEAPLLYTDRERGYSLAIPPGADAKQGEKHDIVIQSRKGYRITVQTARHNNEDTLWAMLQRLEALYLGPDKTWNRKFGTDEMLVAGLEALSSTYEGPRTRVRCVLVRGVKNDTVFMFFAPPTRFDGLVQEFDWILANFKPAPADMEAAHPVEKPLEKAAERTESTAPQWLRFSEPSLGYIFAYPPDWSVIRASDSAVVVVGPEDSPAFDVTIAIQNVEPRQNNVGQGVLVDVAEDLKAQFRAASGATVEGEGTFRYKTSDASYVGRQILASYEERGTKFKQLTLVIPHGPETAGLVHVWSFRAPDGDFDAFRPIAERILQSFKLHEVRKIR